MNVTPKLVERKSHTFQLSKGKPVLPKAENLEELQQNSEQVLLSGLAHRLKDDVRSLIDLKDYDQSSLDHDPARGSLIYSGASHNANSTQWSAAWPSDETVDLEMKLDKYKEVKSFRAFGPSRMGRENFDANALGEWEANYVNEGGREEFSLSSPGSTTRYIQDQSSQTLTVISERYA